MYKKIILNKMAIEVNEMGNPDNQTIIFAHGLGTNCNQWLEQMNYFTDYHLISISLQGHGHSDKPNDHKAYSIESYLDTYDALIKKLGLKDLIWIGNSMGGVLGYAMMKRQPDLIRILITNGTTPKLNMSKTLLQLMGIVDRLLIKFMSFKGYIKFAANHSTQYDKAKGVILDMFSLTTAPTIISSHQILGHYDYLDQLSHADTCIHIIKSPQDKDINKYLNKYSDYIINEQINIIDFPNTGHICNIEKPNEYNLIIENIINNYNQK